AQIFVPASMTDCIISSLICSPRRGRAAARSVAEWLRSCPSPSTIWNSSSIPMVRRGTSTDLPTLARSAGLGRHLVARADPPQITPRRALDRSRAIGRHDALPPPAVDPLAPKRADPRDDPLDAL